MIMKWEPNILKKTYLNYETVEDKIIKATNNYYKEKPELLPVSDGRFTLSYNTLVEGEYIKPLNELLKDGDNCTAEIYVVKAGDNYSYIPKLNCGENYSTIELYKQILAKTEVVETGSGLYRGEDGTYYFRGKVNNNYVAFGTKVEKKEPIDILWQIISISNNGIIRMRATIPAEEKTEYDNRFNVERNASVGYNDFELGIIHSYLNDLAASENFLTSTEKSKLVADNLCIEMRTEEDTTKDGSTECSRLSSDKMLFGTLTPYEYMKASLDEDCLTTTSKACSNYNFLSGGNVKTQWIITASPINNYQAYTFNGKYFELTSTRSYKDVYITVNLNELAFYKAGTGTKDDPYRVFKQTTKKSTTDK